MSENDDKAKGEGNSNETPLPNKPKKIKRIGGKMDPSRSKSAPIETFEEEENDNNYIGSYNYYLYYNSIKPVDPRLPKPTYTPKPNLEFIRESKEQLEEDETFENTALNPQIENIANEMEKLNLESNPEVNNNNNNLNKKNESTKQEDENFVNFKKNFSQSSQNQNQYGNPNQDAPSPLLEYYSFNKENETQRPGENMYSMPQMQNMNPNIRNNPMNQMYGVNLYNNIPPYGNMMQMQMYNNNIPNMNQLNNKRNQKKMPKQQDNHEWQNNMYLDQRAYPPLN